MRPPYPGTTPDGGRRDISDHAHIALVGGGHVHVGVLRQWAGQKRPPVEATLIASERHFLYSGMIPGWIAGHYRIEACRIDLAQLAVAAGVELCLDSLVALDASHRCLRLQSGKSVDFERLSLAAGGITDCSHLAALGARLIPIRPLDEFVEGWRGIAAYARMRPGKIVVVGGGAAGVELACAIAVAFAQSPHRWSITLVASRRGLLEGFPPSVILRTRTALRTRGISLIEEDAAGLPDGLLLSDGSCLAADWVVAATGIRPLDWLAGSGLALRDGYPIVDSTLRSISHRNIFAAGDIASQSCHDLPKAGVQAVRQAPILASNIAASIARRHLVDFHPPKRTLYIIGLGDRRAILSWGGLSFGGRLMWRLKDWIDRRYVGRKRKTVSVLGKQPSS